MFAGWNLQSACQPRENAPDRPLQAYVESLSSSRTSISRLDRLKTRDSTAFHDLLPSEQILLSRKLSGRVEPPMHAAEDERVSLERERSE
jgi:hypothetical protein